MTLGEASDKGKKKNVEKIAKLLMGEKKKLFFFNTVGKKKSHFTLTVAVTLPRDGPTLSSPLAFVVAPFLFFFEEEGPSPSSSFFSTEAPLATQTPENGAPTPPPTLSPSPPPPLPRENRIVATAPAAADAGPPPGTPESARASGADPGAGPNAAWKQK